MHAGHCAPTRRRAWLRCTRVRGSCAGSGCMRRRGMQLRGHGVNSERAAAGGGSPAQSAPLAGSAVVDVAVVVFVVVVAVVVAVAVVV